MLKLSKMGSLVDIALSIGLGMGVGVSGGLLLTAILWKPVNKYLDKMETEAYNNVWGDSNRVIHRLEDESNVERLERAEESGEPAWNAVADGESLVADAAWREGAPLLPMVIHAGELPGDSGGVSA